MLITTHFLSYLPFKESIKLPIDDLIIDSPICCNKYAAMKVNVGSIGIEPMT